MNKKTGILLVSLVIAVIVLLVLASVVIYSGTEIISKSKYSEEQESYIAVKAVVNYICLNQINITPNFTIYGKPLQSTEKSLNGWYLLEKDDLEKMGITYVDETYVVNYIKNKVYTFEDFQIIYGESITLFK